MKQLRIAIDGPAGAGKSTVAKRLSARLGVVYIDTGAMYRAVAWLVVQYGQAADDEEAVAALLEEYPIRFDCGENQSFEIYEGERNITAELRTPQISSAVSRISAMPKVRALLTEWQRGFAKLHPVVMDGRDIGTVVLPDAEVKIFLTASLEERARRRTNEFEERGFQVSKGDQRKEIVRRDTMDSSRDVAPMRQAEDAHVVDSTGKSVEQVVDEIMILVMQRSR